MGRRLPSCGFQQARQCEALVGAAGSTERLRLVGDGFRVTEVTPVSGEDAAFGMAGMGWSEDAAGKAAIDDDPALVAPLTAP